MTSVSKRNVHQLYISLFSFSYRSDESSKNASFYKHAILNHIC